MLAALADAERFGKAVNAAAPPLKFRGVSSLGFLLDFGFRVWGLVRV